MIKHAKGPWSECRAQDGKCPCGLIWSRGEDIVIGSVTSTCEEHNSSNLGEGYHRGSEVFQGNKKLMALGYTAPHECDNPECEGNLNRKRLSTLNGLYNFMKEILDHKEEFEDDGFIEAVEDILSEMKELKIGGNNE